MQPLPPPLSLPLLSPFLPLVIRTTTVSRSLFSLLRLA
jgi:hypothetical protein